MALRSFAYVFQNAICWAHDATRLLAEAALRVEVGQVFKLNRASHARPDHFKLVVGAHLVLEVGVLLTNAVLVDVVLALTALESLVVERELVAIAHSTPVLALHVRLFQRLCGPRECS